MEFQLIFRSQLGPSIHSGFPPCAGIQMFAQSTHLLKNCYPQLVLNSHCSEIWPPKCFDYRCMQLHPLQQHFLIDSFFILSFCFFLLLKGFLNYMVLVFVFVIFIILFYFYFTVSGVITVSCILFFLSFSN